MSNAVFPPEAHVFQGSTLLAPGSLPDARLHEPLPQGVIQTAFSGADLFAVPPLGDGAPIGAVEVSAGSPLPEGWRAVPMRQALSFVCAGIADGSGPVGRLLRAYHIAQWRRESAYCGSCGSRNTEAPEEFARLCPSCGRLEFPRISPAVIVIIINSRGEALLAHNKKFAPGLYSLIAGFNEAGESLESTVAREIREEVGLGVADIRYITSQPWPFPNSLMLGFTARHASGEINPDRVEIEDAQWFPADKLPLLPSGGSVSRYLINRWIAGEL